MKDGLGPDAVRRLATAVAAADSKFNEAAFVRAAVRDIDALELKQRVHHVIAALRGHLPASFPKALAIVVRAKEHMPPGNAKDSFDVFAAWPLIDWVAVAGIEEPQHFDAAMQGLRQLTGLFTAEFAVRAFILADPPRALATLGQWTADSDEHVRRLVSEGTRPRLPWAPQLPMFLDDPTPCLPLLDALKDDVSEYVRRSVGNHLNDVAKDHAKICVRVVGDWLAEKRTAERLWIAQRALRTLVKQGDKGALRVLGITTEPKIVAAFSITPKRVTLGGKLALNIALRSTAKKAQRLVVDFAVHHRKKDGSLAAKVFKCKTLTLGPGEEVVIDKSHNLKPATTRRYYSGEHAAELLVSGQSFGRRLFHLRVPAHES